MAAAAEADGGTSRQAEGSAFRINNFEIPFHTNRSITVYSDLGSSHSGLRKGKSAFEVCRRTRLLDYAEFAGNSTQGSGSILRHAGIYLVRPSENAAFKIENFAEARFAQEIDGFRRTLSAAAMRHNFTRRVQFVNAARQFAERDQMSI